MAVQRSYKCFWRTGYFLLVSLLTALLLISAVSHPVIAPLLAISIVAYWLGFTGYYQWLKHYYGPLGEEIQSWPFDWGLASPEIDFTMEVQNIAPREIQEGDFIEESDFLMTDLGDGDFAVIEAESKKRDELAEGIIQTLKSVRQKMLHSELFNAEEPILDRLRDANLPLSTVCITCELVIACKNEYAIHYDGFEPVYNMAEACKREAEHKQNFPDHRGFVFLYGSTGIAQEIRKKLGIERGLI